MCIALSLVNVGPQFSQRSPRGCYERCTHYGNSRVSATSFYQHYARHIGAAVQDAFGVEMLRVEACLGQAWLKRQRVLRDPGLIDDPRPPPKRREPSA